MRTVVSAWIFALAMVAATPGHGNASDAALESYIKGFDYWARAEMKVSSDEIAAWVPAGKAQLVDIRFAEEIAAWGPSFSTAIPLPELPGRLEELDRGKIIVTACPHKDRAIIAMVYLRSKGYDARYLTDGLLGLAEYLRGDRAREFVNKLNR